MIWIFPMAGRGTRVARLGWFKPFIPVLGRPILEWCLTGLADAIAPDDTFVFVVTEAFEREFGVQGAVETLLARTGHRGPVRFAFAADTPPGPAASAHLSAPHLDGEQPCTVVNCDQLIQWEPVAMAAGEGVLPLYFNTSGASSYVTLADGLVTGVHEKVMVSNYASAGVYALGRSADLIWAIEDAFARKLTFKDEYYVGPALNALLERGVKIRPARAYLKYDLGNEAEIAVFERRMGGLVGTPPSLTAAA